MTCHRFGKPRLIEALQLHNGFKSAHCRLDKSTQKQSGDKSPHLKIIQATLILYLIYPLNICPGVSISSMWSKSEGKGKVYKMKKKTLGAFEKTPKELRKERDLNPRYPLGVCVLSRDVLSATQPSFPV